MALSLTHSAITLIENAGYTGLAVGLVLDSAGIPIPSEILIPLAGVSAHQGVFNVWIVAIVAIVAQTIGGIIAHEVGRRGGRPLLNRYGKYVFVSKRELALTEKWFERYGYWLALVGRCMPVIRGYVGFVAGLAKMPLRRFIPATLIGSTIWTLLLIWAGYQLANDVEVIDRTLRPFSAVIVAAIIISMIIYVGVHIREGRKGEHS